ncbi:MAG: hypothetical protein C0501_00820 [Isosphaera sp.]|nr:hypothetical protein [Isosphaera sp.]
MTTARRAGTVSAAALTGLAAALVLAHSVAPVWAADLGLDLWNLPAVRADAAAADEEAAAVQARQDRVFLEIQMGEHLAERLAAGTLTLAAAVDRLEPSLRRRTGFGCVCAHQYQAPTFRHGVARYAINRAERALADDPARWAEVGPRLEAEYAALR